MKATADRDTTHPLAPHRLGVAGIDHDRTGWVERHYDAIDHPTTTERNVTDFARLLTTFEVWYGDDGYGMPEVLAPMLDAFVGMLNLDLGRLDAGTLDTFAARMADRTGWNLDTGRWAAFEARRDTRTLGRFATHDEAWHYILTHQGQSVDHATRHEGWSIVNVPA